MVKSKNMSFLTNIFGSADKSFINKAQKTVDKINLLEPALKELSNEALKSKTAEFKDRLSKGETLADILPEAYALVREASVRTLGQRHYDVQMLGGIALFERKIAEMRTGEGKTLVGTLPTYLFALSGRGVHVVTVNDYLSKRDASWMGQIFDFLGLSVGVINSQTTSFKYDPTHSESDAERDAQGSFKVEYDFLKPCSRGEAYKCDITYGTNNEFGFDYLRDNLARKAEDIVQREHYFALVDEIDSILIDEARTPLIIAGNAGESQSFYKQFAGVAKSLIEGEDYTKDEKHRSIAMTDKGIEKAEKILGIDNIYSEKGVKYVHFLETAVRAKALFIKDKEYVIQDGEVMIVDTFTGRLQPGRRWNEGLHQAIEAKEGVAIKEETRAIASITYQNYFKFYENLSGMTGTAKTSEEEFQKVYRLDVVSIPTHRNIKRIDHNDLIYKTEKGKFIAIAKRVKELNEKGQPVLLGTASVERNELLSAYLNNEGVRHEVLNAKNHEREGDIIANAGGRGSVVVATNMAGRGVDIKLGGKNATPEQSEEIKSLGGLFVLGTERHEARRIDNQLRGRAGRQGDPGETQFFVSLDDDLMRVFGGDGVKNMLTKLGMPEDQPIENRFISNSLEKAQARIEGFNFDSRKYTLEYDNVLNQQRESIYKRRRTMLKSTNEEVAAYLLDTFSPEPETVANLERVLKYPEVVKSLRAGVLQITDMLWMEHIESMDYMRSSVNLRSFGGHDPLIEYKREGLSMFKNMEDRFHHELRAVINQLAELESKNQIQKVVNSSTDKTDEPKNEILDSTKFEGINRNDPCPCGSGKKFKKCHGINL
jgi:preprotein translocase subunit SecA